MSALKEKHCVPCRGGVPPMTVEQAQEYLKELAGWELIDGKKIAKEFKFARYLDGIAFAQKVGALAEEEGHHPHIHIFYKKVRIEIWTHKIDGLTESDFILAAKIDDLTPQPPSRSGKGEGSPPSLGEGLGERSRWPGVYAHYRAFLPPIADEHIVTLLEGNTPLVRAHRLEERFGLPCELHLKLEGANPTGSFKDRGMTVAISQAKQSGAKAVICASTGNTAASAAAYAARAGMKAFVVVPQGQIALGKLAGSMVYGATVIQIQGNFDRALEIVRQIAERYPVTLVNSVNPHRLEGQKTAAFEICDALGRAPDYHALPVGNAGNITAYWKGYCEYFSSKQIAKRPVMLGFQAEGAAPIVLGHPVEDPQTVATAIKIGNPASWRGALTARDESGGLIATVSDAQILEAYRLVAQLEGVFCEPASAASVAGVLMLAQRKYFESDSLVVCTLTGHGLKDPDTALATASAKPITVRAELNEVLRAMGL
jgi:threonine synthase